MNLREMSSIDLLWFHNTVLTRLESVSGMSDRGCGSGHEDPWQGEQADQEAQEQENAKHSMVHS